jgi:hypothetical protein
VKVATDDKRYPWIVKVSRVETQLRVELTRDVPEPPAYESNNGALARPKKPSLSHYSSRHSVLVDPRRVDKAIVRAQREADRVNAEEEQAETTLKRLARQEAGPE